MSAAFPSTMAVFGGDVIGNERIPFDYTIKETGFGPDLLPEG